MGTLRSTENHEGLIVNGIRLGSPQTLLGGDWQPVLDDGTMVPPDEYRWNHERLPNGEIIAGGVVVFDKEPEMLVPAPGVEGVG